MSAADDTAPCRFMLKSKPIVHGYIVSDEMLEQIARKLINEGELKKVYERNGCPRIALIDWLEKKKYDNDIIPLGWRDYRDGVRRFYNLWVCTMFITRNNKVPDIPLNADHFLKWWKATGRLDITKTAWAHTMKYPEYLCLPDWMLARMEAWTKEAIRRRAAKLGSEGQPTGTEDIVESTA